eukprot:1190883-Amphidinium_carterae.1
MPRLQEASFGRNHFTGTLPAQALHGKRELWSLVLSENSFSGIVPDALRGPGSFNATLHIQSRQKRLR